MSSQLSDRLTTGHPNRAEYADKATILVVDDTATNLEVLSTLLEQVGYQVAIATDGESALESALIMPPDLILVDVMMPGIDGFETCRRFKQEEATQAVPIIFTTSLYATAEKVKAFSMGAVDYITKPFQTEEVLARIQTHLKLSYLNQRLELRVTELNQTLEELKRTQAQLVQSEKMSGLGHLVAGIAHEINNPINFIYGNAKHVNAYTEGLIEMLQLYHQRYPNPSEDILSKAEELDIDFICQDLPKLTGSMRDGANRIQKLVLSLRNFSRLDEAAYKLADVAEGLDSTLRLLQHRLKATENHPAIEIVRDFDAVPLVECYPSELNQVFMHVFKNAIDAFDRSQSTNPQIQVRVSRLHQNWVKIDIADNGPGIPTEVQNKIFDPFFTTKPVGSGTGLGLSISYQIIEEKHQGKLRCQSDGKGTEFSIRLPIKLDRK